MTVTNHLDDATLMSYAAGSLPSALSAVAAAHAAVCARCRRELVHLERIGAAILAGVPPAALDRPQPDAPGDVLTRPKPHPAIAGGEIPAPLASVIGAELDAIAWKWLAPGVWQHRLALDGSGDLRLIKAAPGCSVPEHGHNGAELTLVLRGALRDATGHYGPGDVADVDETIEHKPIADPQAGCICVVASEKPARFRGLIARLLQPLHGL